MVGAREERKSRSLEVTGEGREGDGFFRYAGTDKGEAWVGGLSCAEAGHKKMDGEEIYWMAGGEGEAGQISVSNNKRQRLGPEW